MVRSHTDKVSLEPPPCHCCGEGDPDELKASQHKKALLIAHHRTTILNPCSLVTDKPSQKSTEENNAYNERSRATKKRGRR